MKKIVLFILISIAASGQAIAEDVKAAERYQREAEYYKRQAENYQRDAESYLREARSKENDAAYYMRNKNYSRARDCFRDAASKMDWYQTKIDAARRAASNAEDYYKRAADALR